MCSCCYCSQPAGQRRFASGLCQGLLLQMRLCGSLPCSACPALALTVAPLWPPRPTFRQADLPCLHTRRPATGGR